MKILKNGKLPKSTWYVGQKFDCNRCGFQGELEKGDLSQNRAGEYLFAGIEYECPSCGGRVLIINPNWRPDSVDLLEGNALDLISAFNAVCKNPKSSEKCLDFLEILHRLSGEYSEKDNSNKVVQAIVKDLEK